MYLTSQQTFTIHDTYISALSTQHGKPISSHQFLFRNFDPRHKIDQWPASRDKVWCVTGAVTQCHVPGWPAPLICQQGTNKQMWQVWDRANTRGISRQLPQAEAPDPDKLETTGSLALWCSKYDYGCCSFVVPLSSINLDCMEIGHPWIIWAE